MANESVISYYNAQAMRAKREAREEPATYIGALLWEETEEAGDADWVADDEEEEDPEAEPEVLEID